MVKTFPLSLLLASPFFTILRLAFHAYGSIFMVGSSGQYAAECSRSQLALMMLKAYWSGLKSFPQMWRARRKIRRFARLTNHDFVELIRRHRISLRALTLGT
jgi:hypothetical protein